MSDLVILEKIIASSFAIVGGIMLYSLKKHSDNVDMLNNRVTRLEENIVPEVRVRKIIREEITDIKADILGMRSDLSEIKKIVTDMRINNAKH